jgi:prefoldin subunit 5
MKLDGAIKDLQKEKHELESKLKNVNVALAALTKLAKPDADAKAENNPNRATSPLTPVRAGPAQPANRAPGT